MNYRLDKYGNKLSVLGFGCMRFPQKLGRIDMAETEREIMTAIEGGVNYFDTAYIYPGSEAALGEILAKNGVRERVHIATKLPHYLIKSREGMDKLFNEELRRLQTDHVDFYLMHMLADVATWERLCELGVREWIADKKADGAIRQIGFSYHGNSDMFCKLLDAYDWDFCQVQYNYMDEHSQAGRRGVSYVVGIRHAAQEVKNTASHILVGRLQIQNHRALRVQMIRNGAGIVKTLRLDQHDLQLRRGMNVNDLVSFAGSILLRRALGRTGHQLRAALLLDFALVFRITEKILQFSEKTHGYFLLLT